MLFPFRAKHFVPTELLKSLRFVFVAERRFSRLTCRSKSGIRYPFHTPHESLLGPLGTAINFTKVKINGPFTRSTIRSN